MAKTTQSKSKTSASTTAKKTKTGRAKAKENLENMKFEVAGELGIPLKKGDNSDLTSKEAGYIGGYMVKKLVDMASKAEKKKK